MATLLSISPGQIIEGDALVDEGGRRIWVAVSDARRVDPGDCYNCGGDGYSIEGGDCPACKGEGKYPLSPEVHIDVKYIPDGGYSTRCWAAVLPVKLNIRRP